MMKYTILEERDGTVLVSNLIFPRTLRIHKTWCVQFILHLVRLRVCTYVETDRIHKKVKGKTLTKTVIKLNLGWFSSLSLSKLVL